MKKAVNLMLILSIVVFSFLTVFSLDENSESGSEDPPKLVAEVSFDILFSFIFVF